MTSSTQPRPHATGAARSRLDPALVERLTAGVGTSAEPVTTRAPFTGRPLAHIPQSTSADVERAFTAARAAQREWAELSPRQRARPFARFHDVLLARQAPGVLRTRRRQGAVFTASLRALKALRIR